jgi:hypothetical protein
MSAAAEVVGDASKPVQAMQAISQEPGLFGGKKYSCGLIDP